MAFCSKCGSKLAEGVKFCQSCGTPIEQVAEQATQASAVNSQQNGFAEKISDLNNTPDSTGEYSVNDIEENKLMAVLAYLGLLWLIPFFCKKRFSLCAISLSAGLKPFDY